MTKKSLVAFAAAIKTKFALDRPWVKIPIATRRAALDAIEVVEKVAADFNPKFDSNRFRVACGMWAD